jgi:hypothetical protein
MVALIFNDCCCPSVSLAADYIANVDADINEDSNNNETTSDGSTTDETTRVDTIGDESNASKDPVISLNHFIAFLLN